MAIAKVFFTGSNLGLTTTSKLKRLIVLKMLYVPIKRRVMSSEDIKLRIELLKLEYSIIKDKLLLFSAGLGGSFTALFSLFLPLYAKIGLWFTLGFSFIGLLLNLDKAGKILIEIKELKGSHNDN